MNSHAGTERSTDIALRWASALYLVGLIAHNADHIRRGTSALTTQVLTLGFLSTVAGVITMWLIFTRNRRAPLTAAIFGFQLAIGVSAVHLLPKWSAFSDAFPGGSSAGVNAFSYTVVLVEIAGGIALGIAGTIALSGEHRIGSRLSQAALKKG